MEIFITIHIYKGFILLLLTAIATCNPRLDMKNWQKLSVISFFILVLLMGLGGLAIGVYRHPTSISIFQVVTTVGMVFASIGLLALMGKIGKDKKSQQSFYMNGLGGSLIATTSASLFFLALQFIPDIYQANTVWFAIAFIAVPVILGRRYIHTFDY